MKKLFSIAFALILSVGLFGTPKQAFAQSCSCWGAEYFGLGGGVTICNDITFDVPDKTTCSIVGLTSDCSCHRDETCGEHGQQACKVVPSWVQKLVHDNSGNLASGALISFLKTRGIDLDQNFADEYNKCVDPDDSAFTPEGKPEYFKVCAASQEDANTYNTTSALYSTPAFNLCKQAGGTDENKKQCTDCATSGGVWTAIGCIPTNRQGITKALLTLALGSAGGIILLRVLQAAFILSTSQGEQNKVQEAREILTSSIAGFLFIVLSMVLLNAIGVSILRIPGF